mmetsp:Transcript_25495/g.80440  ORF Transcript_25495/g.80440 Transcript_25495/m.80440 type:complete len:380 (-) Transcript_25495:95-1234(-)
MPVKVPAMGHGHPRASRTAVDASVLRLACLELLDGLLLRTGCSFGRLRRRLARAAGLPDLLDIHGELDGVDGRLGPQVVHARLEAQLPAVEVHGRELRRRGVDHVDVQRLRLVDVSAPVGCHVEHDLLLDLPDGLVELLEVRGQLEALHAAVVGDELRADVLRPELALRELAHEVAVHLHELARERAAHVEVLRVGLEGLVVPQDLRRAGRGHGGYQQGVPEAVLRDLGLQARPVPAAALGRALPEVELQEALARGRAWVALVGPVAGGKLAAGLAGGEVDGLEDVLVEPARGLALEGQAQQQEGVRQALDAQADGPVPQVGAPRLLDGVEVALDDLVEVPGRHLCDLVEALEVILPPLAPHEGRQRQRGQVADGHLVG